MINQFKKISGALTLSLGLMACSQTMNQTTAFEGNSSNTGQQFTSTMTVTGSEANVMAISVTGQASFNQPVATVKICTPGSTTACTTVDNLLVDTGSYGLRIFAGALSGGSAVVTPITVGGNPLAECVSYLDGTGQWGAVAKADVVLGTLTASSVPIEIINPSTGSSGEGYTTNNYPTASMSPTSNCSTARNLDTISSGYNGIIGVGLFVGDCGTECETDSQNTQYYTCTTSVCSGSTVTTAQMVSNPIAYLSSNYNNGVIMQFPNVADAGASTVSGYLIFGIGTETNNTAGSTVTTYTADADGNFSTSFAGSSHTAFIDSGSNGLYFPGSSEIDECSGSAFYCPSSEVNLLATMAGVNNNTASVSFFIANTDQFSTSNSVFNNIGANMADDFDWGFPFFLGRTIFVGIDGKAGVTTSGGTISATGPYWAY